MKKLRTILGIYSFILTAVTIFSSFKDGPDLFIILLVPLPLYFIVIAIKQLKHFLTSPNRDFTIDGYSNVPSTLDLRFLTTQTSPTFLFTICLFSFAISGTVIRAFLLK
jgi:hypothetical protein